VTGLAPAPISYDGASLRSLSILGGAAADRYQFDSTPQNARGDLSVTLTTGPRDDYISILKTASDLIVDAGAGPNAVDVIPSAVPGELLVQSPGGTYTLRALDEIDPQARAVTLGTFLVPPMVHSLLAPKPRRLGTIDGFSPGEILYDPASLLYL